VVEAHRQSSRLQLRALGQWWCRAQGWWRSSGDNVLDLGVSAGDLGSPSRGAYVPRHPLCACEGAS
jgi:hypothetical protein